MENSNILNLQKMTVNGTSSQFLLVSKRISVFCFNRHGKHKMRNIYLPPTLFI